MLCRLDVFCLSALVAPAKQNEDGASALLKINTVAGTVMDTQLTNTFANRFSVACVSLSQPIQSRGDHGTGAVILEPLPPLPKRLGLL
jgi:hypothetical protein